MFLLDVAQSIVTNLNYNSSCYAFGHGFTYHFTTFAQTVVILHLLPDQINSFPQILGFKILLNDILTVSPNSYLYSITLSERSYNINYIHYCLVGEMSGRENCFFVYLLWKTELI